MTEESLFQEVLAQAPEDRASFLQQACAGRPELRASVEALLAAHLKHDNLLDRPAAELVYTQEPEAEPLSERNVTATAEFGRDSLAGVVIGGRYTLHEKIGEGGMGEVWVAKQTEPVKRKVALKLIKTGMDSRAVLQRFEQERQALALMDHPNIARVLDGGMTPSGQPFFVMELVNGLPLNKFCDEAKFTPRQRLELFVPICQAVQHAHHKGIVHRDLKPANILVTLVDGRPVPKVIDFGVAKATSGKLTEETMSTGFGAVVGTLEYMSPEQAGFSNVDIDTRADIYSLGVILYELLTGLRPIDAKRLKKAALTEMIRIIREEEPSKPSTRLSTDESLASSAALRHIEPKKLMALLRGDLDWVVMKCLEKQRDRRYETANGLARDIQRYLDGDAVEACPPSMRYRLSKFARKHRSALVTVGAFALLLVMATAISAALAVWANRERDRAVLAESAAKEQQTRAESREIQAIDAVKRFGDVVANEGELKNSPQLEGLRKTLLKEPLAFFKDLRERLQADDDTRPESLDRLASASFDLGTLTNQIGDKQDALIAHREAMAILQKLADANPTVTKFQSYLAYSHTNIGLLLSETGKPAEALESYESALAIRQKLADANPTVTQFLSDLAISHNNIGVLRRDTGKPGEALVAFESALAIQQKLADANPTVTQFLSDLAISHNNIGRLLRATGLPGEALEAYGSALAIQQKLADANPTVTEFQRNLAASHNNLGVLLRQTGKLGEALQAYESALAIQQKLADANPTVTQFQNDLAASHLNIGSLLSETGKPAIRQAYESALAIQQKLADANPTVTEFQSNLALSHYNIGNLLSDNGKPAEALEAYQSALAIWQKLADANPTVTEFQDKLPASHNAIGNLLSATGKPGEALAAYESGQAIFQKLADANPTVPDFQSNLAASHNNIGLLLSETGKLAEALEAFESSFAILERLAREHPDSSRYASNLGGLLNNMALIDLKAKRFEAARDRLQQAVVWQKKALAANPRNPTFRQVLGVQLTNLIKATRGLDDAEGAADAERELAEFRDSDPAMIALDARLAAIIKGDQQPGDNTERLALAQRAYEKSLHATAARLFAEALAADPKLADDRRAQIRYNAACVASLAGCGKGKDDPAPDDGAKTLLRQQALDWLKAELATWTTLLASANEPQRAAIATTLQHWKVDSDLSGIRDSEGLESLLEAERESWKVLWTQVDELLAKATAQPDKDQP